jgi:hypothetical protein
MLFKSVPVSRQPSLFGARADLIVAVVIESSHHARKHAVDNRMARPLAACALHQRLRRANGDLR